MSNMVVNDSLLRQRYRAIPIPIYWRRYGQVGFLIVSQGHEHWGEDESLRLSRSLNGSVPATERQCSILASSLGARPGQHTVT